MHSRSLTYSATYTLRSPRGLTSLAFQLWLAANEHVIIIKHAEIVPFRRRIQSDVLGTLPITGHVNLLSASAMTPTCVKDDDRSPIPLSPRPSSELGVPAELRRVDDKMMAVRIRGDKRQQRRRSRSQSRVLLEVDVG
jgi:hypothetical protein